VSRAKKEHGGTGTFSTGIYWGRASSVEFSSFLLVANHTANCSQNLLEVLLPLQIHGKSNHIILLTMVLLLTASHSPLLLQSKV
jgi:hypothetical protein